MVFAGAKVAAFVDGCFWHGCPQHFTVAATNADYWAAKVRDNTARDKETNRKLVEAGWLPLRFWEHEDPQHVAREIHRVVTERRAALPSANRGDVVSRAAPT
jgi:DNA mismatch endonuclease (patch repair protein)